MILLRIIYRTIRWIIEHVPGGCWLWGWTDPHYISHSLLRQAVKERAQQLKGRMLDLGCGAQPYRDLFGHVDRYVGMDMPGGAVVDVYGSGTLLPFASSTFDSILCNEVIEHVPEPSSVFVEIYRVLKPGGILLLTTPQTWGLHLEPFDFYRYTSYGLQYLASKNGLTVTEVIPTCGLWATMAQRVVDTVVFSYLSSSPSWLARLAGLTLIPVLMIGFVLDQVFGKRGDTLDNVLVAAKPSLQAHV
jgi:SAM-dependent methyltransferase